MNQDAIWDHFQNEGVDAFGEARARLEFLVRQIGPGERMLNIGVGSGELERMSRGRGIDVWALDPSERAIDRLSEELSLGEQAKVGYSQDIPFPDGAFDVVVMSEVVEHLEPQVLHPTLAEVKRVLRNGGRFIGTVPAREDLSVSMVVCPDCGSHFHRWGHRARFDEPALRALLSSTFPDVRIEEHFFIEWETASWSRRLQGLVKKFLSARGIGTYGTARNFSFVARRP